MEGKPTSSPTIADGIVYVGSEEDPLFAIDAATGQQTWRLNPDRSNFYFPVIVDGVIYVYRSVGSSNGYLYAYAN